ncbi:MAG: riboflavin synthase, partial [Lentisphaeria bacterium]|nr:riboflavin synthase [Lentisphaeria bacterium]
MFTGLVEMTGKISGRSSNALIVSPAQRLSDTVIGESIAVNGCCLTLERETPSGELVFHTMAESLRRTNLGTLPIGARVNLERALASGARLGGHIVQGHVDTAAKVVSLTRKSDGDLELAIELAPELAPEVVTKGSVAIDGVSLTVVRADDGEFAVRLIPQTL